MQQQKLCLKWNNHTANLLEVLGTFRQTDILVDVTISCEGRNIKAHKMVLSACSPYFQNIFLENPCQHPIVIINGMKYEDVTAILNFMYKGEVNVSHEGLSSFLQAAEALKVRGLAEVCGDKNSASQDSEQTDQPQTQRTDTPTKKRHRNRKRSLSDSNKSDDEGALPRKQKDINSPEVHDLSGDEAFTGDMSSNGQLNSRLRQNMYSRSHQSSNVIVEEVEDEYEVEPSKLMEQTLTTENVSMNNSTSSDNLRIEHIMSNATEMESSSLQEPDSPPDIKPIIEYGESSSGLSEGNILPYNEQSQPGPSSVQDSSLLHDNSHTQDCDNDEVMESTVSIVQSKECLNSEMPNNLKDYQRLSTNSSETNTDFSKKSLKEMERETLRNKQLLSISKELVIVNDQGCMRGIDPKKKPNWNKDVIEFHNSPPSFDDDSNDIYFNNEAVNEFLNQDNESDDKEISTSGDKSDAYAKSLNLQNFKRKQSLFQSSDFLDIEHKNSPVIPVKKERLRKDGQVKKKPGRKPGEQKYSSVVPVKKENLRKDGQVKKKPGRKPNNTQFLSEQNKLSVIPVKKENLRKDGQVKKKPGRKPKPMIDLTVSDETNISTASKCEVQFIKSKKGNRPQRKTPTKSASEMLMIKKRNRNMESSTSYFKEMMSRDLSTINADIFDTETRQEQNIKKVIKKTRKKAKNLEKYGPKVLPPGWRSILIRRKSGLTAGSFDIYFVTPEGNRLRSKVQIAEYIRRRNLPFSADEFCFRRSAYNPNFESEVLEKNH